MNEAKPQWEPTGLERFGHLEDKIFRLVEEFKSIRKDNETLRTETQQLKEQIASLRAEETAVRDEFQKEREELRERVEKALSLLATLEAR
jgi:uncharacterized protein YlxW (UPF0749 family)